MFAVFPNYRAATGNNALTAVLPPDCVFCATKTLTIEDPETRTIFAGEGLSIGKSESAANVRKEAAGFGVVEISQFAGLFVDIEDLIIAAKDDYSFLQILQYQGSVFW